MASKGRGEALKAARLEARRTIDVGGQGDMQAGEGAGGGWKGGGAARGQRTARRRVAAKRRPTETAAWPGMVGWCGRRRRGGRKGAMPVLMLALARAK